MIINHEKYLEIKVINKNNSKIDGNNIFIVYKKLIGNKLQ